eukprot:TRINITY_DN13665_c0_g1_i4.p1 TRINITY_DN13665_c0_g1~~TRINITY_DN13665_c0_g1_i4.p1  ORF type:complete len:540 (+),score=139.01 TRINITY_DN13665_c0_g1_i4:56-1675(+)
MPRGGSVAALPDCILVNIFTYLPDLPRHATLSWTVPLVCSRFRGLLRSDYLWEAVLGTSGLQVSADPPTSPRRLLRSASALLLSWPVLGKLEWPRVRGAHRRFCHAAAQAALNSGKAEGPVAYTLSLRATRHAQELMQRCACDAWLLCMTIEVSAVIASVVSALGTAPVGFTCCGAARSVTLLCIPCAAKVHTWMGRSAARQGADLSSDWFARERVGANRSLAEVFLMEALETPQLPVWPTLPVLLLHAVVLVCRSLAEWHVYWLVAMPAACLATALVRWLLQEILVPGMPVLLCASVCALCFVGRVRRSSAAETLAHWLPLCIICVPLASLCLRLLTFFPQVDGVAVPWPRPAIALELPKRVWRVAAAALAAWLLWMWPPHQLTVLLPFHSRRGYFHDRRGSAARRQDMVRRGWRAVRCAVAMLSVCAERDGSTDRVTSPAYWLGVAELTILLAQWRFMRDRKVLAVSCSQLPRTVWTFLPGAPARQLRFVGANPDDWGALGRPCGRCVQAAALREEAVRRGRTQARVHVVRCDTWQS